MKNLKRALSISIAGLVLAAAWPPATVQAIETESPAAAAPRSGVVAAPALPPLGASLPVNGVPPTSPEISAGVSAATPIQAPAAPAPAAKAAAAPASSAQAPAASKNASALLSDAVERQGSSRVESAPNRAIAPEQAKVAGDKTFDGAFGAVTGRLVERPDWLRLAAHKLFSHPAVRSRLPAPVASLAPIKNQQQPPQPRVVLKTTDEFGGPNALKMRPWGRVTYGFKWGLNLLGISTLMKFVLGTIISAVAWQLHLPSSTLHSMGRVELLTRFGPNEIAQLLQASPLRFFAEMLPMATGLEELAFRLGYFVAPFLALAAIKPLSTLAAKIVGSLADPLGWRAGAQKALAWAGKLSVAAFPLAALYSAHHFAVAHFAAWGAHPYNYLMHGALGYALAYVLYRSRSILSPFVAHLTYNALAIALSFLLPPPLQLLVSSLSLVALFWNWRVHRKALAAAYAQAKADARVQGKKTGKGPTILLVAALLGGALLGMGSGARTDSALFHKTAAVQVQDPDGQPAAELPQELKDLLNQAAAQPVLKADLTKEQIVAKVMPSVVEIFVHEAQGTAIGSGYIVTPDGLLFTNAHVAAPAGVGGIVEVHLSNGQKGPGKVVAVNTDKDIALIQLPPLPGGKKWPTVALADSDKVALGQDVLAIGNPLGFSFSVSHGIVSGMGGGRNSLYVQWLQTDAPINHGNSGGPLFNMQGEVVGMNTWIASPQDAGSIGLGFSIVSNDIKSALDQYQATGNINSAWLGIIIDAEKATLPERGVAIEQVRPGSPAANAGMRPGDVLVGINGNAFPDGGEESLTALASVLAVSKPGDALQFTINRDGSEMTLSVKTGDKQPPLAAAPSSAKAPAPAPQKKP